MDEVVARHVLEVRVFEDAVSEVWHARHIDRSSQRATVRIVDLSRDPQLAPAVESFVTDARAASHLVHRNIVRAYDIGDPTQPYVLGRFTPVLTWSAHVRDGIGATEAIALLGPLAIALDGAADAGVVHGAVHPASIWVEDIDARPGARRAVLSGFGLHHLLAVIAAHPAECRSVDDFLYVAPELLRGAAPTNRSDQYSLAAALQHALTGRPPFLRDHLTALFGAHMFGRRPSLETNASDPRSAAELDRIVGRALARDPADRFDSCQDFMDAVVAWQAATTGARPHAVAPSVRRRPPTPLPTGLRAGAVPSTRGRRSRTALLAAAALVAGLLGVFWLASGPMTSSERLTAVEGTPTPQQAAAREAPSSEPSVRWRQRLPSGLTSLQTTAAGPVAVTEDGALLLDPRTGEVRANLFDGRPPETVAAGDRIVSADGADLRAVSVVDGSTLWQVPERTVTPTVAGDTVYGVTDEDLPQLVATDAASGDRLWEFPRDEAAFPADAAVAARDDFVYLADGTALYGILPEGEMAGEDTPLIAATEAASEPLCLWRHEVDEDMWTSSLRALDGGVVIASRSGTVCLRGHADGAPAWCVDVPGVADAEPMIYPADDRVLVATQAGVAAIDAASGEVLWSREGTWQQTVATDGRLIAIDQEGRIAALSAATGTLTHPADTTVGTPSALAADGDTLYVGHRDGTVLSVQLARGIRG